MDRLLEVEASNLFLISPGYKADQHNLIYFYAHVIQNYFPVITTGEMVKIKERLNNEFNNSLDIYAIFKVHGCMHS